MKNIYEEWLHSALMDIRIIEKVLDDPFLTPIACFHAQQCIEKTLKAILEKEGREIPKTHDVIRLLGIIQEKQEIDIDVDLLQKVGELYIESRYPGDFGLLPDGKPTLEETRIFYLFAKGIYESIKNKLDDRQGDD